MTTPLDKRKQMEAAAREVVKVILRSSPNCGWLDAGSSSYSRIDGMLFTGNLSNRQLVALIEIKCRNISIAELFGKYNSELMVDASKVDALKAVSTMLCAPSYLVCYLLKSGTVLKTEIANDKGALVCEKRNEIAAAPSQIGGPVVEKEVSYIKLDGTIILSTQEAKQAT
jgi:hypothetical protein